MSLYLGHDKVGVSHVVGEVLDAGDEVLHAADKAALQDATGWRTGIYDDTMSVSEMVEKLKLEYGVNRQHQIDICPEETWVRPQDWPDLDSLNLQMEGDDFIYMTYDANRSASAIVWHIETADKQPATLDIGHITNGEYIVDESYSVTHNTDFVKWTDDYSGYLVLRITGQITYCYAKSVTRDGQTQFYRQQPILERIAWVPHLLGFCTYYSNNCWGVYTLEREKVANPVDAPLKTLYYAWNECKRLKDLDISNLYTPNVTDMQYAFVWCQFLKELDLRHWNVEKVTSFSNMFNTCYGLQFVNLTGWNTIKATNFSSMFISCRSLIEIKGLVTFNTSKATSFANLFSGCMNLKTFPVENWDTSNCTNFNNLFNECYQLQELDLSNWDVKKVTNIGAMFSNCQTLKRVCFDDWETGELTNVSQLFNFCLSLEAIDVSWIHLTDKCTSIYAMFSNCWSLKELNIPNDWDLSGLGSGSNTANSFCANCYSLEKITGIKDWQFSFTNVLSSMFTNCRSLREIDVSGWKTDTVTSLASIFNSCYSLEHLDLSNWETDNCTNLSGLFQECWSLKSIGDISNWDTSKVTTFASMFSGCWSLETFPDITKWDFSAATTVLSMFSTLQSIKEITINNLSLPECTTIATMFRYCRGLEKITLTNWSIPKVTTTPGIFLGDCPNLRDVIIDIPIALNHSYNGDTNLSHESLLAILNNLPTVTTRRTLNLMTQNINRLTAEEKQIATNKNWTLAN